MQVILLERVEKLGMMGQVVDVKPGYARNYLLPQRKALRASKENMDVFEKQRAELEAKNLKAKEEAEFVGKKLSGLAVCLVRQAGETGQLYGSVIARDIVDAILEVSQVNLGRQQISIASPIKSLGVHSVDVILHPEVRVSVSLSVAQSLEEARKNLPSAEESAVAQLEE